MENLTQRMRGFFMGTPGASGSSNGAAGAGSSGARRHSESEASVAGGVTGSPGRYANRHTLQIPRRAETLDRQGETAAANDDYMEDMPAQSSGQQGMSEPASPITDSTSPENNPYAPEFKFPPDKSVVIRFVPYNPFFPTVEKEASNGSIIPIGRHQRHGNAEDPLNEGIYFRSTVVSRKHAILMFVDGEVS
jgi:hypothetical protein